MNIRTGKLSNYIGQVFNNKREHEHFSMVDKDLQNIWQINHDIMNQINGKITIRPTIVQTSAKAGGTPTQVTRGLNIGYSLPTWDAATRPDEELHFRMRIPIRWDGVEDPQFGMCVSLVGAEDVGDRFQFQLEWQATSAGMVMGTTTSSCTSEQIVLTGRNDAYDTYFVFCDFNTDDTDNPLLSGEMLQARLRRVAATASEVTNEIIVWDWATMWKTDKIFGDWSHEENAT